MVGHLGVGAKGVGVVEGLVDLVVRVLELAEAFLPRWVVGEAVVAGLPQLVEVVAVRVVEADLPVVVVVVAQEPGWRHLEVVEPG